MSLRDAILQADDLPFEDVPTPEWASAGVHSVRIRALTGAEQENWEQSITKKRNSTTIRASLVALTLVDPETGERVFDGASDVEELAGKNAKLLDTLWTTARRLSGMKIPGEQESPVNPSEGDQEGSNASGSPMPSENPTSTDSETD